MYLYAPDMPDPGPRSSGRRASSGSRTSCSGSSRTRSSCSWTRSGRTSARTTCVRAVAAYAVSATAVRRAMSAFCVPHPRRGGRHAARALARATSAAGGCSGSPRWRRSIALHELYWMIRPLRPVVLAGYAGALAALVGRELGGADWALAGLLSTFVFAFVIKAAGRRRRVSVSRRRSWARPGSALGLAQLMLLRDIAGARRAGGLHGAARRLGGRHGGVLRRAAVRAAQAGAAISPGKTWEGFVAGIVAAIARHVLRALRGGLPDDPESLVLGAVIAIAAPARRPVRVGGEARRGGQGLGPPAGAATAACSTGSTRSSSPGSPPTTSSSPSEPPETPGPPRTTHRIHRTEEIRAHGERVSAKTESERHAVHFDREADRGSRRHRVDRPAGARDHRRQSGARACALASGSNELDGLALGARYRACPGRRRPRLTLLERAEPDVVLNAVVGFAGLAGDAVGARARRDARAREQGEPRRRRRARARGAGARGRAAPAGRQRALRALPVPRGPRAETVDSLVLTASGGPFRGRTRERARRRHAEQTLWRIRPGAWARRSPSTPRRSRTRGSS